MESEQVKNGNKNFVILLLFIIMFLLVTVFIAGYISLKKIEKGFFGVLSRFVKWISSGAEYIKEKSILLFT